MSQQVKLRTRQARGPTAAAPPSPTTWFFYPSTSTLNLHSETVIQFRQHCGPIVPLASRMTLGADGLTFIRLFFRGAHSPRGNVP
jgi:hypothetical protein